MLRISRTLSGKQNKFLNPRNKIRVGVWNVRTLNQDGKLEQLIRVFDKYSFSICGISETRWTGLGRELIDDNVILHSGRKDNQHYQGVALILNKFARSALIEWNPVSERILYARFKSVHGALSVIMCYAPTNEKDDATKDEFYSLLQEQIDLIPRHDLLMCMGDFNAQVGNINDGFEGVMGRHGLGTMNDNGLRLASFCAANELVVGGTLFEQLDIHKYTWTSPNGLFRSQIDHICINRIYSTSLNNVRVSRGADIGSDHELVISTIGLKLRGNKIKKPPQDIIYLSSENQTPKQNLLLNVEIGSQY